MTDSNPPQVPSLRRRFLSAPTIVSFALVLVIGLLLATRFDIAWSETIAAIRRIDPWWYLVATAVHYTTFLFRGARWRLLLENAGMGETRAGRRPSALYFGRLILMSWFVNSVTWFRMGDAYRAYAVSEDLRVGFPKSMGTVLADRVVDLAVVLALMVLAVVLLLAGGKVHPPVQLVWVSGGLLVVAGGLLLAMWLFRRWVTPRLPRRLADTYRHFHDGTMGSFGRLPAVFTLGLLGWLSEVGRLFFVLQAVGVPIALGLVLFVPMANGLLSAVPLTPGGLGIVESGVSGLLRLELSVELAIAVALVDRTISYVSIVLFGGIAFALRQVGASRPRACEPDPVPVSRSS